MLLTKTFESAVRELIFLAGEQGGKPCGHRNIAEALGESPSYLAKITGQLVKANILRAHRGAMGGVTLNRTPDTITLIEIYQACQGALVGDYCQEVQDKSGVCSYHLLGVELHEAVSEILGRWTLTQLMERPNPSPGLRRSVSCRMQGGHGISPLVSIKSTKSAEDSDVRGSAEEQGLSER